MNLILNTIIMISVFGCLHSLFNIYIYMNDDKKKTIKSTSLLIVFVLAFIFSIVSF